MSIISTVTTKDAVTPELDEIYGEYIQCIERNYPSQMTTLNRQEYINRILYKGCVIMFYVPNMAVKQLCYAVFSIEDERLWQENQAIRLAYGTFMKNHWKEGERLALQNNKRSVQA